MDNNTVEQDQKELWVVVDMGIDHLEDGDWMWVECENEQGEKNTYWKKREDKSDNPACQMNKYAW